MGVYEDLLEQIGDRERVTVNETVLEQHSKGIAYHAPRKPDVVVFPKTAAEVSAVLAYANERRIPVTPFGAGSSLEGHIIPVQGGITLNLTMMNHIIDIRPDDFLAIVEPGVTRMQLNQALKKYGLFFPVDPGADATLGGMAATNASGTNSVKYGVMRDQVLGLEVVLADGKIVHTGGMAAKSSAGYDLTGLFVGSEGTLGVFTKMIVRLQGIPEATNAIKASFPTLTAAAQAAALLLKAGVSPGKIELVDEQTIQAVNQYKQTNYPEAPTLFIELSGSAASVKDGTEVVKEWCAAENAVSFETEDDPAGRAKLWEARHHAAFAIQAAHPGKTMLSTDVCVPVSKLPEAIAETRKLVDEYGITAAIFGHVGDGNYHTVLTFDPADAEEVKRVEEINARIVRYALSHGGTCTGEHGIGIGKRHFLYEEHRDSVPLMQGIKRLFDPNGIMNPGKIFLSS
ncbi:FAD-binding oxidoreductase [Parageobacillus thermoglucosidasius]|nr:FAD-linked oxidase C-terminal domain-containing protein [Parageobacillus thermoglucosidasius]KYD12669.1 D-Lactate dehydrogenase, cytochrome c-dependent [Anoxybacillus flavithermus]EID42323.1 FAD/FMN-containing dehydrogenase [Parageobacillus thermoglucosidasius TNO-09.020]OAO87250.1 D-Lactate dehydrogenase cytochrome c-dependent [Parageobacillus thermoglucosidasius]RDE29736.1 FAD-binding protein [Parageobacillus thermoglucosidasius]RDE36401.1 FAD-binding protein [Parageobacillus thermoglucos